MKKLIVLVLLLGVAATVTWYFLGPAAAVSDAPAGRTLTIQKGTLVETAAASGKIAPHAQVDVKSRAAGQVIEILVKEGQTVAANDLLVRLDPVDTQRAVESARIALKRLEAQLADSKASLAVSRLQPKEAKAALDVIKQGAELGVVAGTSQRTASSASQIAAYSVASRLAQIAAMEAQIEAAKIDLAVAERHVTETEIHAPFAGTVLAVGVAIGTIVSSATTNVSGGSALVTLADLSDLRVIGQIDEANIGRAEPGQEVKVRVDAYPERAFSGKVERVSPLGVATSNVVTFDVEIIITDADKGLLRSGMSSDVEIVTRKLDGVMLVPLTAITSRGPARFVKLADGSEKKVQTGATDGQRIVVTAGVEVGETILAVAATPPKAGSVAPPSGSPFNMGGPGGGRGMGSGGRGGRQ